MKFGMRACAVFIGVFTALSVTAESLEGVLQGEHRTASFVARDEHRHPLETLNFFQVSASDTVVEIWPGGGWYAEILAPWLNAQGNYYAAHFSSEMKAAFFHRSRASFEQKVSDNPAHYSNAKVTAFFPPAGEIAAPSGSADKVLTFRNVHNWLKHGYAPQAFSEFYKMLKPGGVLGVVEHRAQAGTSLQQMNDSGYVTEEAVKQFAREAGFEFVASSPINNNSLDTKDHPRGVWTLPPSLRLGDERRSHYVAIGESDRMTLMFRKPE